jgi:hypothetical protein
MDERFCYCICICNSSFRNSESVTGENSEFCYVFRICDPPTRAPYHLKGFHLLLEMWRDGQDDEGWKICAKPTSEDARGSTPGGGSLNDVKIQLLAHTSGEEEQWLDGPISGLKPAAPCFKEDLEAILQLAEGQRPALRCIRSKLTMTAYYGFGDASSGGFGATVERPSGLHSRYGLRKRYKEGQSSNYWELRNLVNTVEEEAKEGYLKGGELWLFPDNSTVESCFHCGGLSSKLLHELVVCLRKAEIKYNSSLHVVHVAGTRMIAQGTDGLSGGSCWKALFAAMTCCLLWTCQKWH